MSKKVHRGIIIGRGGLKIPEMDFGGETHPGALPRFFKGLWILNRYPTREDGDDPSFGADQTALGYSRTAQNDELVIPGSSVNPLTVTRFNYTPPVNTRNQAVETHEVLLPPTTGTLSFSSILKVTYKARPSSGMAGDRDFVAVESNLGNMQQRIYDNDDEFYNYTEKERAQQVVLGRIMRECVELLSE